MILDRGTTFYSLGQGEASTSRTHPYRVVDSNRQPVSDEQLVWTGTLLQEIGKRSTTTTPKKTQTQQQKTQQKRLKPCKNVGQKILGAMDLSIKPKNHSAMRNLRQGEARQKTGFQVVIRVGSLLQISQGNGEASSPFAKQSERAGDGDQCAYLAALKLSMWLVITGSGSWGNPNSYSSGPPEETSSGKENVHTTAAQGEDD